MSGERHAEIRRVFALVCGLEESERAELLDQACAGDAELRAEVVALLRVDAEADGTFDAVGEGARFLADVLADDKRLAPEGTGPRHVERVGKYRIQRMIAQGGMGAVYEAEHESSGQRVALKLVRAAFVTDELLRRFRREVRILGQLRHPGIAQIYDAGTDETDGVTQPFFAMELVDGQPLDRYAVEGELDVGSRLELTARVCDALHYAHERGVVHRDLKPANILVGTGGSTTASGTPYTSLPQPKILDFGVARATDADLATVTVHTAEGQLVGTVPYMSPEQASGDPSAIDRCSDVYAVGVIAFELLAGCLPYGVRGKLVHEAVRIIREDEPSSLGALDSSLRGDVETIVAKALEKDRSRRYATAAEMAADIRRYLSDQPIEARPASAIYQLKKFARRNKVLVAGVVATLAATLVGAGFATHFALDANRRASDLAQLSYRTGISAVQASIGQSRWIEAEGLLQQLPESQRGWEFDYLTAQLEQQEVVWESPYGDIVTPPVIDREGRRCYGVMWAHTEPRGFVGTWEIATGRLVNTIPISLDCRLMNRVAIHADSKRFGEHTTAGTVRFRDLETGRVLNEVEAPVPGDQRDTSLRSWHAGSDRLLFAGARGAWVGDGHSWAPITNDDPSLSPSNAWIDSRARHILLYEYRKHTPAGKGRVLTLVDLDTGEVLARRSIDDSPFTVSFSPEGRWIAVSGYYAGVFVLDGSTLETVYQLRGHSAKVTHNCWSRDGARLATASVDGTVRIWTPGTSECVVLATNDRDLDVFIRTVTFLPGDGSVLYTGGEVRVYPVSGRRVARGSTVLRGHDSFVYRLAFSPDGTMLASSGFQEPNVHVWDVAMGRPWRVLPGPSLEVTHSAAYMDPSTLIAFSHDSRELAASNLYETLAWRLDNEMEEPRSWIPPPSLDAGALNNDRWKRLGRALNAAPDPSLLKHSMKYSPDRRWAAATSVHSEAGDYLPDAYLYRLEPEGREQLPAIDSRDGVRTGIDGWRDLEKIAVARATLGGHQQEVLCAAFHPDGTRLATAGRDQTIRIWDLETFETLLVLRGHEDYVMDLAFSPDGLLLASASGDKTIRLWDALPLRERRALSGTAR